MKSKNPVFVFGCPRSGNTITSRIIGAHPKVRGVRYESRIFSAHGMNYLMFLIRSPHRKRTFAIFEKYFMDKIYGFTRSDGVRIGDQFGSEAEVRSYLDTFGQKFIEGQSPFGIFREFVDSLLMGGYETFVEKTPFHCLAADSIRLIYPDAIFVVTSRPYEHVYQSLLKVAWKPRDEGDLKAYVLTGQNLVKELLKDDARTIWFDTYDLVQGPDSLIKRLVELGFPSGGVEEIKEFYNGKFDRDRLLQYA